MLFFCFHSAQFDNNLITPGKYRQRSYDNLKMGKCSSDVNRTVQKHSPSSLSKYRLSTNLSKINNEEQTSHRRKPCAIPSNRATPTTRLVRPMNIGADRDVLSSSIVKLTPHVPTHYKVYGPQKKYKLKNVIDEHNFMYAYGTRAACQNAQNNNRNSLNNREKIDRWTAERLMLLRGDDSFSSSVAADSFNGNHLIDLNDAANSRIT